MSTAVLLTGLPATGKSTLAMALAKTLPAILIPHDWISSALKTSGLLENFYHLTIDQALSPGYGIATNIALANLEIGHHVVIDSLLHSQNAREKMVDQLGPRANQIILVSCVATDSVKHRRLVENRNRQIPNWGEISWEHVERVRSVYEPVECPDVTIELGSPVNISIETIRKLID